jgi:outer membrane lipoprotein-sorting protein
MNRLRLTYAIAMASCLVYCAMTASHDVARASAADTPANATTKTVVASQRKRIEARDFRVSGRLVQAAANGERKSYNFTLAAHWFPDGLRMLCAITAPAADRVRLLLSMSAEARTTIETGKPGDKAPVLLPRERRRDSLLGTGFSYEDLIDGQFLWQKQTLLPNAKYGARDCYVLKSEPGADDKTQYASVTTWIDEHVNIPVHMEKTVKESGTVKQFIYYDLRQTNGVWSAAQIQVKTQGSPVSSLLVIERGSANARLQRSDFDVALLTKP